MRGKTMESSKKTLASVFLCFILIFLISCLTSRIIKQTNDTAIIQGVGITKIEAKINAEEEAEKLFKKYKLLNEPEYTHEQEVSGGSGSSYWSCVIEIKKLE